MLPNTNLFKCPQCAVTIDSSINRIIVESCGHKKCRSCFIKEENGCEECYNNKSIKCTNSINIATHTLNEQQISKKSLDSSTNTINNIQHSKAEKRSSTRLLDSIVGNPSPITIPNDHSTISSKLMVDIKPNINIDHPIHTEPSNEPQGETSPKKASDSTIGCLEQVPIIDSNSASTNSLHSSEPMPLERTKIEILDVVTLKNAPESYSLVKVHVQNVIETPIQVILPSELPPNPLNTNNQSLIITTSVQKKITRFKYPSHITVHKIGKQTNFHCSMCQKDFKSKTNRIYHLYCDSSIEKPLECDECHKRFITASHLKYHKQTHGEHQPVFTCNQCNRLFQRKGSLRKHLKTHLKANCKYNCNVCDAKFVHESDLKTHRTQHLAALPYKCDHCCKAYSLKFNLNQHLHTHNEKKFTCDICNKRFSRHSSLKVHMFVHSKDRSFDCKLCSKSFINQMSLIRHCRTHDNTVFLECPLCQVKSTRRDNMQRHLRSFHAGENPDEILYNLLKIDQKSNKKSTMKEQTQVIQETNPMPVSNAMSVIKFAAKSKPLDVVIQESLEDVYNKEPDTIAQSNEQHFVHKLKSCVTKQLTIDLDDNYDKEPAIPNITIYRKLLSPYLKPPQAVLDGTLTTIKDSSFQFHYDVVPMETNQLCSVISETERLTSMKNVPKKMSTHKIASADQLEIYRRILLPSCDDEYETTPIKVSAQSTPVPPVPDVHNESGLPPKSDVQNRDEYFAEMHWRKRTSQCFNQMKF